jgi:hypothetical protein
MENLTGRHYMEGLGVDDRIILKWNLEAAYKGVDWICFRIGTSSSLLLSR